MCRALVLLLLVCSSAWAYDYPFKDPYNATVLGTKSEDLYPLERMTTAGLDNLNPLRDLGAIRTGELLLNDRPVPEIFWFHDTLQYSQALQRGDAPLLFIIAGTGSSYSSANCQFLQKVFYRAGFHVVCLSSPTFPNFIVSSSTTQVPGYVPQDVSDLYGAMDAIADRIGRGRITSFYLTGYSLGATQSAFLYETDTREKRFGFRKVLLMNPSVNLMTSTAILDHLLADNVADRAEAARIISDLVEELSEFYRANNQVNFGDDFLYTLQSVRPLTEKELKILIGVSFRLSLASMIFASDVCTGAGYIVPRGHAVEQDESLTPYLDAAVMVSFEDYVREYLLPYLQFRDPGMTMEKAIRNSSLESIAPVLQQAANVAVVTNADDPILTPENFRFLEQTFGARLKLYPVGGHCGNLRYKDNVAAMLAFFRE